jgi:hypothetical protein
MEAFRKKSQSEDVKAPIYCRKSRERVDIIGNKAFIEFVEHWNVRRICN